MSLREIKRHEWASFCGSFSRQHRGWFVTIEQRPTKGPPHVPAHDLSLEELVVDGNGNGSPTILIVLADRQGNHVTHPITGAERIGFETIGTGTHRSVQVETADTVTQVRFRAAAFAPEADGE